MIQLTDQVWIGDSHDEENADLAPRGIGGILNVARDLRPTRTCADGLDYAQVGLVDGPGNTMSAYAAATLALDDMVERCGRVLVCCHAGGRSLAVALMYLRLELGVGWDGFLALLAERVEPEVVPPHAAHRAAYDRMNWRSLRRATED